MLYAFLQGAIEFPAEYMAENARYTNALQILLQQTIGFNEHGSRIEMVGVGFTRRSIACIDLLDVAADIGVQV